MQSTPTATESHREKVRATLAKIDPGMLALADACRERFGDQTQLRGVVAHQDGQLAGLGRLSLFTPEETREADRWLEQTPGNRAFGKRPA